MNYLIIAGVVNIIAIIGGIGLSSIHPLIGIGFAAIGGYIVYRIGIEEGKTIAAAFVRKEVDRIIAEIEVDNE